MAGSKFPKKEQGRSKSHIDKIISLSHAYIDLALDVLLKVIVLLLYSFNIKMKEFHRI
jgi:hypothetical protein